MDRGTRRSQTAAVATRRTRLYQFFMRQVGLPGTVACKFARDRNPLGCGRPRCRLCHGDKVDGKSPALDARRDMSDLD